MTSLLYLLIISNLFSKCNRLMKKINLTLAILADRKIDTGHSIKFDKLHFKPMDDMGLPVYYHKGTSVIVIKAFDGNILASINDKVYELDVIPTHELKSKNFDFVNNITPTAS